MNYFHGFFLRFIFNIINDKKVDISIYISTIVGYFIIDFNFLLALKRILLLPSTNIFEPVAGLIPL